MKTRLATSVTARRLIQVLVDCGLIAAAWWLAFVLRFDDAIPSRYEELMWQSVAFVIAGKLLFFTASGMYSKLWRFVDARDFEAIVRAVVLSSFAIVVVFFLLPPSVVIDPPRGVIAADFLLTLGLVAGSRFLVRSIIERPLRAGIAHRDSREVLIVGAGNGGQMVAAELRRNPGLRQVPVGFVDDDPR
jgi:FlaA1/EpsC-like NDP-sugar epimerase